MHITGMTIGGIPPFSDRVEFKFDERVNVFIGPNATGKSTVLRHLKLDRYTDGYSRLFPDPFGSISLSDDWEDLLWRKLDTDHDAIFGHHHTMEVPPLPKIYISPVRIGENIGMLERSPEDFLVNVLGCESSDNALRDLFNTHNIAFDTGFYTDEMVYHATNLLIEEGQRIANEDPTDYFDQSNRPRMNWRDSIDHFGALGIENEEEFMYRIGHSSKCEGNFFKAIVISHKCAFEICSDTVETDIPHHDYVGEGDGLLSSRYTHHYSRIVTSDRGVDPLRGLSMWSISSGIATTLLWIRFMAMKMLYHYNFKFGWEKQPAILLIDEIENHLHPTWQRRVIPALLEHFPGLQIFATTHSPFVVAGREVGQVHQLIRDTNGLITAKTNTEPIKGLTADEISRKYLEVHDPTDLATAEAAAELRKLRNDGPRYTEDAEAARQTRMQELRWLVDRDLLAGGPMAARRELFEQQFNEALEKYRQSRDLGQDSG